MWDGRHVEEKPSMGGGRGGLSDIWDKAVGDILYSTSSEVIRKKERKKIHQFNAFTNQVSRVIERLTILPIERNLST